MQSVENNNNVRIKNPLFLAASSLAIGALLLTGGCHTKNSTTTKVEPPPTVIMPPSPQPTNAVVLVPPPAQPDFKLSTPPGPLTPEQAGGITYVVKNGDSLSKIAAHHGVSAREIAELNNITNPNKIRVGQKLVLPAYAKEGASTSSSHKKTGAAKNGSTKTTGKKSGSASTAKASAATAAAGEGEYVVKSGDSLSKIAAHLHVKVKDLREVNALKNDNLKVGQKLKVPGKTGAAAPATATEVAPPAPAPAVETPPPAPAPTTGSSAAPAAGASSAAPAAAPQTFEVTVEAGETLDAIATKYGVLPADIKKLNNITEVAAGQKIKLPLPTP